MSDDNLRAAIDEARATTGPPTDDGDVTFEAPWQARAFAITVALRREGAFEWDRFQTRLIDEVEGIDTGDEAAYYDAWLRAIEDLLLSEGVVEESDLARRALAFDRGERDASEFVVGDHSHDHDDHDHHHHDSHDHDAHDPGVGG